MNMQEFTKASPSFANKNRPG
uniref:Uncharacterized protein n=1 Tax=Rhizophora mucronata TaxID=61149 RepID=A0A2P2QMA8_RHIMU